MRTSKELPKLPASKRRGVIVAILTPSVPGIHLSTTTSVIKTANHA